MKKDNMKLLIAYDGSESADAMLSELRFAGLPNQTEASVISVGELWLPPPTYPFSGVDLTENFPSDREGAKQLAERACQQLSAIFPNWQITALGSIGSPSLEIIMKSDEWKPDLVIVGSSGHSALGRFVFGSVSQKVVTEAHCSVRVARASGKKAIEPAQIIIGIDGSFGAEAAVLEVMARSWPEESHARLITAIGDEGGREQSYAEKIQSEFETELIKSGLKVSGLIAAGNPKQLILEEADTWKANNIFMGSRGLGRLKRFLLGSVSAAVVARAHCSVEIVRKE
jgi:nucleotide-binding universal stress UspA family protein